MLDVLLFEKQHKLVQYIHRALVMTIHVTAR